MGDLDDEFAAFLTEVSEVGEATACETAGDPQKVPLAHEDPDPAAKRARHSAAALPAGSSSAASPRGPPADARGATGARLRRAAFLGDLEGVRGLLGGLAAVDRLLVIDAVDEEDGFAALHLAVIHGSVAVASALLEGRADVDVASLSGDTPLMWAAHRGLGEMCRELLRASADASVKNDRGRTAGVQAKAAGHARICRLLEQHALDAAAGVDRRAAAQVDAAEERRARNLAMVAEMVRQHEERLEEEAFWAGIRARAEGRKAAEAGASRALPAEPPGLGAAGGPAPGAAEEAARALAALPAKVRPHFDALQAPPDATADDVRKLYRRLALRHHPDKNPKDPAGAKERFTRVAVAYEAVLEFLAGAGAPRGARIAPPAF